jgi:hypothetical protein
MKEGEPMKKLLIGAALAAVAGAALAQAPAAPSAQPMAGHHAGMMKDRVQTRDELVGKVREHFARLDANRDGFVARDEMQAMRGMHKKMGEWRGKDGQRMVMRHGPMAEPGVAFDRLDANKDGMISRDEFAKGREVRIERRVEMKDGDAPRAKGQRGQRMHGMRGGMMRGGMMRMADLDKDGRVSLQEAQDSALRHFDMMDSNRDGRLTPDERREMHMKMRAERAPKAS